jgi:hypothetical protein
MALPRPAPLDRSFGKAPLAESTLPATVNNQHPSQGGHIALLYRGREVRSCRPPQRIELAEKRQCSQQFISQSAEKARLVDRPLTEWIPKHDDHHEREQ